MKDVQLGGFLRAFIAAIGLGVFISGLRWLAMDPVMPKCQPVDYKLLERSEC